jgi:hypothetical protein
MEERRTVGCGSCYPRSPAAAGGIRGTPFSCWPRVPAGPLSGSCRFSGLAVFGFCRVVQRFNEFCRLGCSIGVCVISLFCVGYALGCTMNGAHGGGGWGVVGPGTSGRPHPALIVRQGPGILCNVGRFDRPYGTGGLGRAGPQGYFRISLREIGPGWLRLCFPTLAAKSAARVGHPSSCLSDIPEGWLIEGCAVPP